MGRTGTTRRHALRAAGAATVTATGLLAGCTPDSTDGGRVVSSGTKAARAESALRLRSADTSRKLLGRYDAVLTAFPDTSEALAPLRAAVARQVDALAPPARKPTSPAPSARPSSSAAPSPSATARPPVLPAVAADAEQALKDLAAAERRTADAHTATLMDAPPELARLLASLAAASAAHAYLLSELLTKGSAS
ncbi:hypothetical protein KQY30_08820 [Streptomyces sp. GMY02]|uniref:hypothetical protein n=1 Tax=Streptomyces sp. GMY02 TaxID=1333528 RepID=UPI001C2B8236|nr:hypothetical protein [Streptomyces sp. GMY02]QXE34379.1 hypothetical protein KQY30_08820 [Streptomyces sp. GMY02]